MDIDISSSVGPGVQPMMDIVETKDFVILHVNRTAYLFTQVTEQRFVCWQTHILKTL